MPTHHPKALSKLRLLTKLIKPILLLLVLTLPPLWYQQVTRLTNITCSYNLDPCPEPIVTHLHSLTNTSILNLPIKDLNHTLGQFNPAINLVTITPSLPSTLTVSITTQPAIAQLTTSSQLQSFSVTASFVPITFNDTLTDLPIIIASESASLRLAEPIQNQQLQQAISLAAALKAQRLSFTNLTLATTSTAIVTSPDQLTYLFDLNQPLQPQTITLLAILTQTLDPATEIDLRFAKPILRSNLP